MTRGARRLEGELEATGEAAGEGANASFPVVFRAGRGLRDVGACGLEGR